MLSREAHVVPRVHPLEPCLEDSVTWLDAGGHELHGVSVLDALWASPYAPLLDRAPPSGDVTHTNTLVRLDGRFADWIPAFREGHVLVSIRELDALAVIDPERAVVTWALAGAWRAQHEPVLLDDGRMLLFDNRGHFGRSRILEFDPLTQHVAWTYTGSAEEPFFSAECGSVQRLPGGTTLITETDVGRAFEVTDDGTIVWEYRVPYRTGDRGQYVASLFEVVRLPPSFGREWRARR